MTPASCSWMRTADARARPDARRGGAHERPSDCSSLTHDLAVMIPPPLTGALWVIYVTGVLEIAGAIGLLTRPLRRLATWGLMALLAVLFPANIYAALSGVTVGGAGATPLLVRAPLQVFWIALLWWSRSAPGLVSPVASGSRSGDDAEVMTGVAGGSQRASHRQ